MWDSAPVQAQPEKAFICGRPVRIGVETRRVMRSQGAGTLRAIEARPVLGGRDPDLLGKANLSYGLTGQDGTLRIEDVTWGRPASLLSPVRTGEVIVLKSAQSVITAAARSVLCGPAAEAGAK